MRLTRRGRLTVTLSIATLALAGACATYAVTRTPVGPALGFGTSRPCVLDTGAASMHLTREQAMSATTLAAVGERIGAVDGDLTAAVVDALAGDRHRVVDPADALDIFRLLPDHRVPAAPSSLAAAAAVRGHRGPALTCTVSVLPSGRPTEPRGADGLTPRAETLRLAMRAVFGKQVLGGFAPGGVTTGHVEGSAHYEGRAVDVFFRPISAANQRRGWLQAQWAVAHAQQLQVATVIFDRQIWSAGRSPSGWRDYVYPGGPTDNPVLLHEDHVHVDVHEGSVTS